MSDVEGYGLQDAIKNAGDQGIVVIPQGISWRGGTVGWEESCNGYDVAFYDAMVKYVTSNYCIDKNRMFVTGFSWGADMTNALACCRGAQIRGVAPFSGSEGIGAACSAKVPAVRFRYGGLDEFYSQQSFQATLSFYKKAHSCSADSSLASASSSCKAYKGCDSPVLECGYPTLHHASPSPAETAETWQFWKSLP